MGLYFSNEFYKQKALNTNIQKNDNSEYTKEDAILTLFKDVGSEDLFNLTALIKEYYRRKKIDITIDEAYSLTQGNTIENKVDFNERAKRIIYRLAYKCIENDFPLGTKTIMDGKINTSDWMAHCLFEGKLAGQLAEASGLNGEKARKLGILHDYGRKIIHNSEHIIRGYEELVDKGLEEEAISCLTHSFLGGGRSAWNDEPEEGFYLDEEGNPCKKEGTEKDDLSEFLDNYDYTKYDIILNISDLMATSHGIVSPSERIADIATRRKAFEPISRTYFLAEFTNRLMEMLKDMGGEVPKDMQSRIRPIKDVNLEQVTEKFERASKVFYEHYQKLYGAAEQPQKVDEDIVEM